MFSRKKETVQPAKSSSSRSGAGAKSRGYGQINLLDVPDLNDIGGGMDDDLDDDDDDLEAELLALQQGLDIRKVVSRKRLEDSLKPKVSSRTAKQAPSDDEDDDDDVDENDPDLLAELQDIEEDVPAPTAPLRPAPPPPVLSAPPTQKPRPVPPPQQMMSPPSVSQASLGPRVLPPIAPQPSYAPMAYPSAPLPPRPRQELPPMALAPTASPAGGGSISSVLAERLQVYKAALVNAKSDGESAKIRRIERGIKTLESLLKSAKAGKPINDDDIPPPVAVGGRPARTAEQMADRDSEVPRMPEMSPAQPPPPPSHYQQHDPTPPPRPGHATAPTVLPPIALYPEPSAPPPPPRTRSNPSPYRGIPMDESEPSPQKPAAYAGGTNVGPAGVVAASESGMHPSLELITTRRQQYRTAALAAKRENDKDRMLQYVKIAKQFDAVITALENGEEVDLSGMPPPPPISVPTGNFSGSAGSPGGYVQQVTRSNHVPSVTSPAREETAPVSDGNQESEEPVADETMDASIFKAPPPPSSVMEALQQRLEKYKSAQAEAQSSDNGSKARRMGRIVKQYEDAIKQHRAGKPVQFDELPVPPGFGPIPQDSQPAAAPAPAAPTPRAPQPGSAPAAVARGPPLPARAQTGPPTATKPPAPSPPTAGAPAPAPPPSGAALPPKPAPKAPQSLHERQLFALMERQKLFKAAALDAKKRDDLQAAKEYLRVAKGFDPMISASKCGLPVNMDSLPTPPQANQENSFEIVDHNDCVPVGERDEMFVKLEKELQTQIEMCQETRVHLSKIGDVQSAHKFDTLFLNTKKDLDFVRYSKKRGDDVPRFHYETRAFSIVKCSTDLLDDDLELTVIKGINYTCPNPKEVDTYVKFELPFPPDAVQSNKTATVHNTNNPEYNAVFKLAINRKSRVLTSVIKRKAIKLEVWSKGSFLRSDTLLGTAHVKLLPLETRCVLHDSFDLMDGRKSVGGKVEVKVRLRDPIVTKQVETLCEKWLVVNAATSARV